MATRVRFTKDFTWKPKPTATIDYKLGWVGPVPIAAATAAIAAGAAEEIDDPAKKPSGKAAAAKGATE